MWYYAEDNEKCGPVSKEEVQNLVRDGILEPSDYVWTDGMDDWRRIEDVDEIIPTPPPLPNELDGTSEQVASREQKSEPLAEEDEEFNQDDELQTHGLQSFTERTDDSKGQQASSTARPSTTGDPEDSDDPSGSADQESDDPSASHNIRPKLHDYTFAGLEARGMALVLDVLFLLLPTAILGSLVGGLLYNSGPEASRIGGRFAAVLVGWFYYAGFESSDYQATPGKQAIGLKVTDEDGHKIGFARATGRHLGKIISAIPLLGGYLITPFTAKKQALHDHMANCLVLKKKEG